MKRMRGKVYSALNRMPPSNPSLQGSENPVQEEAEISTESEGMQDTKETRTS